MQLQKNPSVISSDVILCPAFVRSVFGQRLLSSGLKTEFSPGKLYSLDYPIWLASPEGRSGTVKFNMCFLPLRSAYQAISTLVMPITVTFTLITKCQMIATTTCFLWKFTPAHLSTWLVPGAAIVSPPTGLRKGPLRYFTARKVVTLNSYFASFERMRKLFSSSSPSISSSCTTLASSHTLDSKFTALHLHKKIINMIFLPLLLPRMICIILMKFASRETLHQIGGGL